jgi:L,D-transpeptidase catalytic domain
MIRRWLFPLLLCLAPCGVQAVPFWGAQESRAVETAPGELKPGEFVWNAAVAPDGPIVVVVSLDEQRAYVYRNAVQIGVTTVSTGKTRYDTPTGVFVVLQKDKDHRSTIYNNAPMPYTQRLTWGGVALHAGGLPGYPSSHGCVHLPSKFAEVLFAESPMGMTVVVVNGSTAPESVTHPPAFAPVDARTGAPAVPARLAEEQEFRLEPEKSRHGPVSLVMSRADRRVLVMRNGVEIGRARIEIRDPDAPLGTHAYVLTADYLESPHPWAPQVPMGKWISVAVPGHFDEAGAALSGNAAARISMPEGFARAVYLMLAPGSTMLLTDAPILSENTATDFTVLSDGPPT